LLERCHKIGAINRTLPGVDIRGVMSDVLSKMDIRSGDRHINNLRQPGHLS